MRIQKSTQDVPVPGYARSIIETLQQHDFQAYIVGGYLRDHFSGRAPKDIDVVTDATPEQIKAIFKKQCILIGKRFRLAHVRVGRIIVEVSTFRASGDLHDQDKQVRSHADSGMILRDNLYGSLEEDMSRRDFTVNALYYDPVAQQLLDPFSGLADLQAKTIRFIGQATKRLQEDPVRLLRAIRFSCKLGFVLDAEIITAAAQCRHDLAAIPAGRLFDEYTKLLLQGHAVETYARLQEFQVFSVLFPSAMPYVNHKHWAAFFQKALANTDDRLHAGKTIHPGFLVAVLLWPAYCVKFEQLQHTEVETLHNLRQMAASETLRQQVQHTAMPKRFSTAIRQIWTLQPSLEKCRPRQVWSLLSHIRFRAAYDFLLLRAQTQLQQNLQPMAQWWTDIQTQDRAGKETMINALRAPNQPGNTTRKNRENAHDTHRVYWIRQ